MRYVILVNGLDHAFLREFGCACRRCLGARRTANTSVSLIGVSERDETATHVLFDVGAGVVESLVCSSRLSGDKARFDALILSHWHPDHTLDLNRLCESWRRTLRRRNESDAKLRAWCRTGTAAWLWKSYPYELSLLNLEESQEIDPPGTLLPEINLGIRGISVRPIAVSHCTADRAAWNPKNPVPCSAAFLIQAEKKAVLLWDIDNANDWLDKPSTPEHRMAVEALSKPDYLFVDCNTWKEESPGGKSTGHASFQSIKKYAAALHPTSETLLMHLSGHEDGPGNPGWGWADTQWEAEAKSEWVAAGLPGSVRVPKIGDEFWLCRSNQGNE